MDDIDLWLLNTDAAQMMTLCGIPAAEETTCLALALQVVEQSLAGPSLALQLCI